MAEPDREAYEQAERLLREAEAAARAAADHVPPSGWRSPTPPHAFPDLSALIALLESARGALPPELLRQVADALRDLLLAMRAVLDYSIDRLERPPRAAPEV